MSGKENSWQTEILRAGDDFAEALDLWFKVFPDPEYFRNRTDWYYRQAPADAFAALLRADDGRVLAAMGLAERRFESAGTIHSLGLCADLAVDKSARSLGPALALHKGLIAEGMKTCSVLYGFPNTKAAPVLRRAGFRKLGDLARYTRVVRSHYVLARHLPGWLAAPVSTLLDWGIRASLSWRARGRVIEEVQARDARLQQVCESFAYPELMRAQRGVDFLQWRYADNPTEHFRILLVSSRADRRPLGFAVISRDQDGHWQIYDLMFSDAEGDAQGVLLALGREAARSGIPSLIMEYLGDERLRADLLRAGFHQRESHRTVYLMADESTGRPELFSAEAWFLLSGDED